MEALRRALGDGKLNFLGLSYGAEIGTLYAERYPKRIRAMALVTAADIRLNAYDLLLFKDPIPAFGHAGWNGFAQALAAAEAGDATAFATPLVTSPRDGTFAGLAVNCVDYPPLIAGFQDLLAATMLARALAPRTQGAGEAWPALVGCMHWPAAPANPPHPARIQGAPPILLVNATHDPSTPYRWAHNVLHQIPGAVLLTRDGDGHTSSLLHPGRTSDAVARYLVTRRTPAPNTVYPD
jgi:pimeloyl-ACP methyl ester carboxylesterase